MVKAMNRYQFHNLSTLARLKQGGKGREGAFLCLVEGMTQVKASEVLGCQQSTISAAVRKIEEVRRLARNAID